MEEANQRKKSLTNVTKIGRVRALVQLFARNKATKTKTGTRATTTSTGRRAGQQGGRKAKRKDAKRVQEEEAQIRRIRPPAWYRHSDSPQVDWENPRASLIPPPAMAPPPTPQAPPRERMLPGPPPPRPSWSANAAGPALTARLKARTSQRVRGKEQGGAAGGTAAFPADTRRSRVAVVVEEEEEEEEEGEEDLAGLPAALSPRSRFVIDVIGRPDLSMAPPTPGPPSPLPGPPSPSHPTYGSSPLQATRQRMAKTPSARYRVDGTFADGQDLFGSATKTGAALNRRRKQSAQAGRALMRRSLYV